MAQWVDMEASENKNHASLLCFSTLWVRFDKSVVSNQPKVGWSRTHMPSVRNFFSFHVYPLSHLGVKGVVVVFQMLVDLFKGHNRIQWGRLPLKTSTGQKPGIV